MSLPVQEVGEVRMTKADCDTDDVSLLCPQNSRTPIELEMAHVLDWAGENKKTVNLLKTVELVFRRPNISAALIPSTMSDVRSHRSKAPRRPSWLVSCSYYVCIHVVVNTCVCYVI